MNNAVVVLDATGSMSGQEQPQRGVTWSRRIACWLG